MDPGIHLIPTDVSDHMIDIFQPGRPRDSIGDIDCDESRQERPFIIAPLDMEYLEKVRRELPALTLNPLLELKKLIFSTPPTSSLTATTP